MNVNVNSIFQKDSNKMSPKDDPNPEKTAKKYKFSHLQR